MYTDYAYSLRIIGRYHILFLKDGFTVGVHYKGYARKGMAERIGEKLKAEGYCEDFKVVDTEA